MPSHNTKILRYYSHNIPILKIILPTSTALLIISTLILPYFAKEADAPSPIDPKSPSITENHMISPSYTSTDNKGQPYEVAAKWGKQVDENKARLIEPKGKLKTENNQEIMLRAKEGLYNHVSRKLELEGQVTVETNDGYIAKTQNATLDVNTNTVEGSQYAEGNGPFGQLIGRHGFKVENHGKGKIITLKGPSTVVIETEKIKNRDKKKTK